MDPLSSVFSLLKVQNRWAGEFSWGRDWCLSFGPYPGIRIYAVLVGECFLEVEGVPEAIHGRAGDCLLLPTGRPFRVGSDLSLPGLAIDASTPQAGDVPVSIAEESIAFRGIGGYFTFEGGHGEFLMKALPPILHISQEGDRAVLRWLLDRLAQELRSPQPGSSLAMQQLATLLLVQALRVHLENAEGTGTGWFLALADKQMNTAITAMHEEPAFRWTVDSLSRRAGMSRTSFAVRFKALVGKAPLEYLTGWRMLLAGDLLINTSKSLAVIAEELGYSSESALSTAFRRTMGCTPREYGQRTQLDHPSLLLNEE